MRTYCGAQGSLLRAPWWPKWEWNLEKREYMYIYRASLVAQMVKHLPAMKETWVQSLGREDPLEKEIAAHSSILAWRSPRTEEPDRLESMGYTESDMTEWLTHACIHIADSLCYKQKWTQHCKATILQYKFKKQTNHNWVKRSQKIVIGQFYSKHHYNFICNSPSNPVKLILL